MDAISAALIASLIYCSLSELLFHGARATVQGAISRAGIVLPVALLGLPLIGLPLARWLQRGGHDGILQASIVGAVAGTLACLVLLATAVFLVRAAEEEPSLMRTGAALLSEPFGLLVIILGFGAPGGALAAATLLVVSQFRARWKTMKADEGGAS